MHVGGEYDCRVSEQRNYPESQCLHPQFHGVIYGITSSSQGTGASRISDCTKRTILMIQD